MTYSVPVRFCCCFFVNITWEGEVISLTSVPLTLALDKLRDRQVEKEWDAEP